ncbi:carbon storage regulator [Shewanella psychrotolerans]|uniref:carbon storage regulator n=1 Tax=Shewanella psychrotolerans TaxID=2864206 RepID=UPI001C65C7B2|nr:carbon storage regulator [Shewanella psychrotolerans]QYJ99757.1 carbon storage regulator [Shewanella psychrotolerans]
MLILTRAEGESLYLDNIYDVDGNQLPPIEVINMGKNSIGVHAANSITILRAEILHRANIKQLNTRYRDNVCLADTDK